MDESELVERVFLRVAATDTDEQLQAALEKFLPGLLLKLSSAEESVRTKVMELLVHVNKRLKSRPAIKLPVDMLLLQYQDPANPPMVTNFTIIYIKMGVPRLSMDQQTAVFSRLVQCLEGKPQAHQDSLLQLLVPIVGSLPMPADPARRKAEYGLEDRPLARQLLLDFMLDILMLPYSAFVAPPPQPAEDSGAAGAAARPVVVKAPACFSELSYKRALGDPPLSAEALEKTKVGILRFLAADVFPEQAMCLHYIVASADSRHSVVAAADADIRRILAGVEWNSRPLAVQLYSIFQGTVVNAKAPGPKPKAEMIKAPAPVRLRLKMFPHMMKSRVATELFPQNVQMVFDCLLGATTNAKLRHFGVQFIHRMTECASTASMRPLGRVFLSSLLRVVESADAKDDPPLRGAIYGAMGKLVHKLPELVADNASCAQMLFQKLCEETNEVKMAIQQALVLMASSYSLSQPAVKTIVEAIAHQYVEKEEPQARMMAVHFAHHVFPTTYPATRFVLLVACGDPKDDVRAEAEKLLHSGHPSAGSTDATATTDSAVQAVVTDRAAGNSSGQASSMAIYPGFPEMAAYLHQMAKQRLQTQLKVAIGMRVLPFNASAFAKMLSYLRSCLVSSARAPPMPVTADDSFSGLLQQAPAISVYVRSLLEFDLGDQGPVQMYIALLKQFLTAVTAPEPAYFLLEIVSVVPNKLPSILAHDVAWLKELSCCLGDETVRYVGAQLLAVVCVDGLGHDKAKQTLDDIYKQFSSKLTYEKQCGFLLMMSQLVARHSLRLHHGDLSMVDVDCNGQSCANEPTAQQVEPQQQLQQPQQQEQWYEITGNVVRLLVRYLTEEGAPLLPSIALKDVGCHSSLCVEDGSPTDDAGAVTKLTVVKVLIACLQDSKVPYKAKEKAALCLGGICVGDARFPWRQKCIQGLLDSVTAKELELSFGIGDALVMAALGPYAPEARDQWQTSVEQFRMRKQPPTGGKDDMLSWLLDQLLSKYLIHPNPHIRQASCIWLLTVVKACSSYHAVVERNERIQTAFMQLLGEADEITQDIASKGLGLTYESSTEEARTKLMTQLVDTLMTGQRTRREVTGETQVFEEGALGKTLDGQNMTTYRELCSIASDLNQPDLVYKFMNLANHNSLWNTRKGAAFGFTGLAAQAGKQLLPHLAKIVPRLYRYMFDPNTKVQLAMRSIWNAVVSDTKEVMDKYAANITEDVILHLTDPQWRVRESCCYAVADLLKSCPADNIIDHLPKLWETLLRVRDDIKESVRKAAEAACTQLSRVTVKVCDPNYGKAGEKAVSLVLPTLLHEGLLSPVTEVREVSLKTILSVSKAAGRLLQPHVDVLVPSLLESLSGLEPQQLNYLALQVAGREDVQERLDAARAAISKSSPMMECINLCLQQADADGIAKLVPRLAELIKSGIGLGTKTGAASVVVALVRCSPKDVQPHAGKLLAALVNGLGDRNATVRKSYAVAIGNLVKVAKDESVDKLIAKLKGWYIEKDDDGLLHACGQTLRAMSESSPDVLQRHAADALSLVYVAMHTTSGAIAAAAFSSQTDSSRPDISVWEETWNEMVPGTELGLRLYLNEIVAVVRASLEASSWHRKAVGAAALSSLVGRLGAAIDAQPLDTMLTCVVAGLGGRTWSGKEALLEALRAMATSCTEKIKSGLAVSPQQIVECAMKEAKKESAGAASYKAAALRCLCDALQSFDIDRFADVMVIVRPLLQRKDGAEADETGDGSDGQLRKSSVADLRLAAYEGVAKAFSGGGRSVLLADGSPLLDDGIALLTGSLLGITWKEQQAVLKSLRTIVLKIGQLIKESAEPAADQTGRSRGYVQAMVKPTCDCLATSRHTTVRQECLALLDSLVSVLKDAGSKHQFSEVDRALILHTLVATAEDSNDTLRSVASGIRKKVEN